MSKIVYTFKNEFNIVIERKGTYHLQISFNRLRNTMKQQPFYEPILPDRIEIKYILDNGLTQEVEYIGGDCYEVLNNKPWVIYYYDEWILSFDVVQVQTLTFNNPHIVIRENEAELSRKVEDKLKNAVEF